MTSLHPLSAVSGTIVVCFCVFLIGMALLIVFRPSTAERFLGSFASSASAHYTEQVLRLIVGASLVNFASSMWCPDGFRLFGWSILVSTAVLLLIPWRWHHKFASRVMPPIYRNLKLFGLGAFLLGLLILYGASGALNHVPNQQPEPASGLAPSRGSP